MPLSLPEMLMLAARCAPSVAPGTLLPVASVESGFDPLAIGVNGPRRITLHPRNPSEATSTAAALIAAGRSVDLGLAQINSANLPALGLTPTTVFDPCRNLGGASQILRGAYQQSQRTVAGEQPALRTALSYYNTGDPNRGFGNGYVARVARAAARIVPAIRLAPDSPPAPADVAQLPTAPSWDVFGSIGRAPTFFIRISNASNGASN